MRFHSLVTRSRGLFSRMHPVRTWPARPTIAGNKMNTQSPTVTGEQGEHRPQGHTGAASVSLPSLERIRDALGGIASHRRGPARAGAALRHTSAVRDPAAAGSVGRARLTRARLAVLRALIPHLDGARVPELVLTLLRPAWRNYLVYVHAHHGAGDNAWVDAIDVIPRLMTALASEPESPHGANEALLAEIDAGLDSIAFTPERRKCLLSELQAALSATGGLEAKRAAWVDVPPGGTAAVLGFALTEQAVDAEHHEADAASVAPLQRHSWSVALDRVGRLRAGDQLLAVRDGRPAVLRVKAVGAAASPFLLQSASDAAVQQVTMTALADGLHTGCLVVCDDARSARAPSAEADVIEDLETQLHWARTHDALTHLMNRTEFERRVAAAVADAQISKRSHALLLIGLDHFKVVNASAGHGAGDALLRSIAARLRDTFAVTHAAVARIGGDEFGVLLEHVDATTAREAADLILQVVRRFRFAWQSQQFALTVSIGSVLIDASQTDADAACRQAEAACQVAKESGRNRVVEHEIGDQRIMRRDNVLAWLHQLDRAISSNRLTLNCQRIAPVAEGMCAMPSFEVLMAVEGEFDALAPTSEFIHVAESHSRVTALDRWVVVHVLRWLVQRRDALGRLGSISINLSGHSINDETFVAFVLAQFAEYRIPATKVCFELTESAAIANLDNARDFMNRLRLIGCRFALDDFGTGLASYAYLRNLPVDYVKIDGVFVRGMEREAGDLAVVRSITEIGHSMGKRIVAEQVEHPRTLAMLRKLGVDFAQGFAIERPMPLADVLL
jgi:diguanylate cyclase (GGDEF)-like protein